MFVIVENIIFLASFDVRLAHAGTSVVFSYLVFCNFSFCLHKFKGLIITLKNTGVLKNFAQFLDAKFIYFSINPIKITFCLFYKNLFSILNFTASGRFRTAATSEMELFCDSSDDQKPLAIVANSAITYVAVLEAAADSVLCL